MKPEWSLKDTDDTAAGELSRTFGLTANLAALLVSRGITSPRDAYAFLYHDVALLHSPFLMKGMPEAVERIRKAVAHKETIGIFSDSDLDGLSSLAVIVNLLRKIMPGDNFMYRFPRDIEQYGLTKMVVDEFSDNNVSLIITLDCGIRDVDEITYAVEKGIDVLVCDHHEADSVLPDAIIINPKQPECTYPFRELAGVGVAFKLYHGVLLSFLERFNKQFLFVSRQSDTYNYFSIQNGVTCEHSTCDTIDSLCSGIYDSDIIITYMLTSDDKEKLSAMCSGKCTDLTAQINEILSTPRLEIASKMLTSHQDLLHMAFVQLEMTKRMREYLEDMLSLVALGSIADIVPLVGENRTMTHIGLQALEKTNHHGLSEIIGDKPVTSKTVGWQIAPLLNSPGRFGKTELTADFLLHNNINEAMTSLHSIKKLNEERKTVVTDYYSSIIDDIETGCLVIEGNMLFFESDSIPDGLAGLLANRLTDYLDIPVIVATPINDTCVKGSGRVKGQFNFFSLMEPLTDLFEKIGGHAQAFGFTAQKNNLAEIKDKLASSLLHKPQENAGIAIDLELQIDSINTEFISSLSLLEPYGHQNEPPVFLSRSVQAAAVRIFGKNNNHIKISIYGCNGLEAIGWNMSHLADTIVPGATFDAVYKVDINEYNGSSTPRMILLDIECLNKNK
jgi:single-stranded-DNA-specific exonuclease